MQGSRDVDDPNKLHHIFANPDHNLDALVDQFGSEVEAWRAIVEAVTEAHHSGMLNADAIGRYRQTLEIGGHSVMVRGRIVNGVARVGSAWIRARTARDNHA
jgi:hypothetical protein